MFVKCDLSVTCLNDMAELSWLWTRAQSNLFLQLGLARVPSSSIMDSEQPAIPTTMKFPATLKMFLWG